MNHETHTACDRRMVKLGEKAKCCYCVPHSSCEFKKIKKAPFEPSTLIEPKTCPECQFEQPRYLGEKSPHQKSCSKYERKANCIYKNEDCTVCPSVDMGEEKEKMYVKCPKCQKLVTCIKNYVCMDCQPVEQKDSWEAEFQSVVMSYPISNLGDFEDNLKDFIRQEKEKSFQEGLVAVMPLTPTEIEENARQSLLPNLLEEIEGMKKIYKAHSKYKEYNQALSDIKTIITNKLNNGGSN